MGNKEKRKNRSRSRSRDRHRDRQKHKKSKKGDSSESDSFSRSSSSSPDHHKKHKTSHKENSSRPRESWRDIEERKEREKEEQRKEKELLKSLETPEEKRARRLAKKEAKEKKRKAQMGWDEEELGYTNVDNPFGDEQLMDSFVWQKKLEKTGHTKEDFHKFQRQKMEETKRELEKVKKRRLEREKERSERDNDMEMMQREKESDYYKAWERQEDTFHLQQAQLRSKIRIEDNRAKPIDLLARYISQEEGEDELSVEMHEPYTYLNGLTIEDLEDLIEDIKVYTELEQGKNVGYWKDITIVTEDELNKLRKIDPNSRDIAERREGINQAVTTDVAQVFKGKTHNQLILLEDQIKNKLKGGEGIDIGYWESLLQQLKAHMARTRLRERHQGILKSKLAKLKQQQGIESAPVLPVIKQEIPTTTSASSSSQLTVSEAEAGPSTSTADQVPRNKDPESEDTVTSSIHLDEPLITEEDLMEQSQDEYRLGCYSPVLFQQTDFGSDTILYDPGEDMKRLEYLRGQVTKTGKTTTDKERESEFEKKAREGMNDDEATFSVEVNLEQQAMMWSDKYRPRKPRFFNRVHTGFEWNKYNQTHYDVDNPPPKIVQGYKFNIFFPDLIDKSQTPEYKITPIPETPDFAVLKFHAGPPYEDIGFKIVNREWELGWKRGFKCQFHNNIFQLWFHFKKFRYRR